MVYKVPEGMKMISVRLTDEEVDRIDSLADTLNLSRANYIRRCLKEEGALGSAEKIAQLLDVLRQLETMMDAYLSMLERLLEKLGGADEGEMRGRVMREIDRAYDLMELLFKAQKQAVRTLRAIRRDREG